MIIQEPVQAAIWHCLNHYSYVDAIFLAERLYAEVNSDDALFLLATCYYRSGKPGRAYSVLHSEGCKSPQCRFLLARCSLELNKLNEVETALMGGNVLKSKTHSEVVSEFGDSACFALQLLGDVCGRTERHAKAAEAHRKSLSLNPFLWSSYDTLCVLGDKPDPTKIFQVSPLDNFNMCQGSNPLVNFVNQAQNPNEGNVGSWSKLENQVVNSSSTPIQVMVTSHTPLSSMAFVKTGSGCSGSMEDLFSAADQPLQSGGGETQLPSISRGRYNCFRSFFSDAAVISPLTPNFGVVPLDTITPVVDVAQSCAAYITPPTTTTTSSLLIDTHKLANSKLTTAKKSQAVSSSRAQTLNDKNKPTVFSQSGNAGKVNIPVVLPPASSPVGLQPTAMANVRRSTRLFSSSNSVKENNKSSSKVRFTSSKTPPRKAKTRLSKSSVNQATFNELNEINKPEPIEGKSVVATATSVSTVQHAISIQKAVAEGLMQLFQDLGKAYLHLAQYDCRLAIEAFSKLSKKHYNTGWVLVNLGKAHFELAEYKQAAHFFASVRKLEPHRMEGMEYYSTTLWHLQREVVLSSLARELTDFEKSSPQAWCAVGNCFSLQKEHDTAIKFFQRAVQVNPRFAYAYTLLGHEYVLTEEMDKAMACFRNALRIDSKHYNAWYGVGMIYFKQEKYQLAEIHYKRALAINPQSSVLMCHVGVAQHNLQKSDLALSTLNRAIQTDPSNPLCKFQRATIYFMMDRPDDALAELEELKEIVPKESLVYFLLGKVHKKLGNTHLALTNFSWAMDLDPKGANNQIKEAIDKRYTNEEEDGVTANVAGLEDIQMVDLETIESSAPIPASAEANGDAGLPASDESL